MGKFKCKSGDKLFVNRFIESREIEYFRHGLCQIKISGMGEFPFYQASFFYAVGYWDGFRQIYIKKRWHYYPAVFCEFIRLFYYNDFLRFKSYFKQMTKNK